MSAGQGTRPRICVGCKKTLFSASDCADEDVRCNTCTQVEKEKQELTEQLAWKLALKAVEKEGLPVEHPDTFAARVWALARALVAGRES